MLTKSHLLALVLGTGLGIGTTTTVRLLEAAPAGAKAKVHVLELRRLASLPDGGPQVALTAYAHRALPDGGTKDLGGHPCSPALPLHTAADALLVASEACIPED
jgi:hypothetical protein